MPVEDLVEWVVLGEAFIYDEQKFFQGGLDIAVPWRVVPGDLSFPGFALSRGPSHVLQALVGVGDSFI